MGETRLRVYLFEGSNACLTCTLMLGHKRLAYERVDLPPALHALIVRALGFPRTTVPAMWIGDRRVQGTLDISAALDREFPDEPLYPSDPAARSRVREAEVWGEKLQNACRRIFYAAARRDHRVFPAFISRGGLSAATAWAVRAATPLIIRVAIVGHGASDERARRDLERLPDNLDRIDAYLASDVLGGERLNAADYQIAPNVRAMLQFADLAPLVDGRPAAAWSMRVVPAYGRPVGAALPDDWIRPLRRR
ncbi:MAG TPA: glutathione S-transferase N-terminal domain-containing protein [Candidatus Polarisedimenticolaceae bacterium]|nr:glutathione S-transferase N-terminal domain-containing protein [Candidatus Polarisedimenticolaceae bacterium]